LKPTAVSEAKKSILSLGLSSVFSVFFSSTSYLAGFSSLSSTTVSFG
jgi:hypothetical protein